MDNILEKISELVCQIATYMSDLTLEKIGIIVSIISGVATVIALIVAIYGIKIWRKQQLYGKNIDTILDLHDNHEILTSGYMIIIKNLLHLSKDAIKAKTEDHKMEINEKIKGEVTKIESWLPDIEYKYQIALFRAARISNKINPKDTSLDYESIRNTFDNLLIRIFDNSENNNFIKLFSESFSKIKTDAKIIFDEAKDHL